MIIRLIKNTNIPQYFQQLTRNNIKLNHCKQLKTICDFVNPHLKPIHFHFAQKKQDSHNNQKGPYQNDNIETHQPKVIQITKQQYLGMKKFLQDITLSMPNPNFSPSSNSSHPPSIQHSERSQQNMKQETLTAGQIGTQFFSSPEQKLSFHLLKLNKSIQFLPIFKQYRQTNDISIKLIILHRYCSIGGTVGRKEVQTCGLAYKYMEDVLRDMRKLSQNELQLFLQLYISMHQQSCKKQTSDETKYKYINSSIQPHQNQLPRLNFSMDQLALISNPTHSNSRLIVLLLQFYQIQTPYIPKSNTLIKQIITVLLKHYQLRQIQQQNEQRAQKQQKQVNEYKNLAYIGLTAYMHDIQAYNAIPKLTTLVWKKCSYSIDYNTNKQLIRSCQQILQNIHKLNHCTSNVIIKNIRLLEQAMMKFIIISLKDCVDFSSNVQGDEIMESNVQETSATVQALLYTSLLVLQQNNNSISRRWSLSVINAILKNYKDKKEQKIGIMQLGQLWKSCSIMYKLISKEKYIRSNQELVISNQKILDFVDCFINKTAIQEEVKAIVNPNNNNIIEEHALILQTILFESLVAYRMVLSPQLKLNTHMQLLNIKKEVAQNDTSYRRVLIDLLTGYRKVSESLYLCGLIKNSHQIQIHNLLIAFMIGEAYLIGGSVRNGEEKTQKMTKYLLSGTVLQILEQLGIWHGKYGNYGKKMLEKYK